MSEESERIEAMKQFVEQFPDNPFPRYALAMEHKTAGRHDEAIATFEVLAAKLPDYVPTYLQFGMVLTDAGRDDDAREIFKKGIDAAKAKGDAHALSELQGALAGLD